MNKVFMIAFFALTAICSFGQSVTAEFKSKEFVFSEDAKSKSSQFVLEVSKERMTEIESITSPMYEHIKFKQEVVAEGKYNVIIYYKPEKDFDYAISIFEMIGISEVIIDGESFKLDEIVK